MLRCQELDTQLQAQTASASATEQRLQGQLRNLAASLGAADAFAAYESQIRTLQEALRHSAAQTEAIYAKLCRARELVPTGVHTRLDETGMWDSASEADPDDQTFHYSADDNDVQLDLGTSSQPPAPKSANQTRFEEPSADARSVSMDSMLNQLDETVNFRITRKQRESPTEAGRADQAGASLREGRLRASIRMMRQRLRKLSAELAKSTERVEELQKNERQYHLAQHLLQDTQQRLDALRRYA